MPSQPAQIKSSAEALRELKKFSRPASEKLMQKFFRAVPGGYGGQDRFFVAKVPETRSIAKRARDLSFTELAKLLKSPWHEARLLALIVLAERGLKADAKESAVLAQFYLKNRKGVNNWDLVDTSARQVLGPWLYSIWEKDSKKSTGQAIRWLRKMARSKNLWDRRIAVVATYWFIGKHVFEPTLILSEDLLGDHHDLIHKATGWMLREVGKRDPAPLMAFLEAHAAVMPRTMLRYSIEHRSPKERAHWMGRSSCPRPARI